MVKKVDVIDRSLCHQGFIDLYRYRLRHRLFSGQWSPVLQRECIERQPVVGVLPYDPVRKQVVLVEQFRVGAMRSQDTPWLLEVVAGYMDHPNEAPEAVAHRELFEETGLKADSLKPIYHYWVSPGGSNAYVTLFYATVDAAQAGGIHGLKEEHEDIRVHTLSLEAAVSAVAQGQINNSMAIIALQWLQLNSNHL